MANITCNIDGRVHFNGGWQTFSMVGITSSYDNGYIGPVDGKYHHRTVYRVKIPAINGSTSGKKITITTNIYPNASSETSVSAIATVTDSGPDFTRNPGGGSATIYDIQGTVLGTTTQTITGSSAQEGQQTFTISIDDTNNNEHYVYVWVYTNGSYPWVATKSSSKYPYSATLTYQDHTAVTTGSISTTGNQIFKPTDTVTVSWSKGTEGINNPINGYNAYLRFGSAPTSKTYDKLAWLSSTLTNHSFSIENATRGAKVYVGVQALGSNGSGTIKTKNLGTINYLPNAPTYTASSTSLNTKNKITYAITPGTDSDSSQTISLSYSLNGGDKISTGESLEITTSTPGVVGGTNTIVFYTSDGLEESVGSTPHSFIATLKPEIKSGSIKTTYTLIEDMNNNATTLATEAKISFTMESGTAKKVNLYVRSGTTTGSLSGNGVLVPNNYYSFNESTNTITVSIINIGTDLIAEGNYFQFRFTVSDGTTNSDFSNWQTSKRRPFPPRLPIYKSYSNDASNSWGANATAYYYKNTVKIGFTNSEISEGYAKVSSISIIPVYGNKTANELEHNCSTKPGSVEETLNLSQISSDIPITFKFKVVDTAGQINIGDVALVSNGKKLTFYKTSNLIFVGDNLTLATDNLRPLTNTQDFYFIHSFAVTTGSEVVYKYYIQIGNIKTEFTNYTVNQDTEAKQIEVVIKRDVINSLINNLDIEKNIVHNNASIIVMAADGFNTTTSLTKNIKVNFTEPPVFNATNPVFSLRHDYYTGSTQAGPNVGVEIVPFRQNSWETDRNVLMVNSGEGIIFVLPKASDPNGDIDKYVIYLSRNEVKLNSRNEIEILRDDQVSYNEWLSISYDVLTRGTQDSNYYYYRYKASQYTKNEYFYFKVEVRDKTGNASSQQSCKTPIFGCRTMPPTFSAGNVKVTKDEARTKITLNYKFKITDLGGSAINNGWDINYYNQFPNFERTISGYTPRASLVIDISPYQTFSEDDFINNRAFSSQPIVSSGNKLTDFVSEEIIFDTQDYTSQEFKNFINGNEKIFMRFTLTVSYGLYNTSTRANVVSVPQVYTYFGSVPTVAHRVHKVGINTTTLDQDDVLVVENYQGTKYVRFKGTDAGNASKTYEITFDLLTGSISGAVIDCGEW